MLDRLLAHPWFERTIITLILLNAVTLGLETSSTVMERFGPALVALDRILLGLFVAELTARLIVQKTRFFKDAWNVFDFCVIAIALVPATGPLSVLRALRVLRVLRLITAIPSLKAVVGALIGALPGMGSIVLLLTLVFYVFAVMATKLFGATHPQFFGSVGISILTLFQVMTLDAWSDGVMRPVMEQHPYAWAFFLPFVLITAFTVLNLFIGVVVSAIETEREDAKLKEARQAGDVPAALATISQDLTRLSEEVDRLTKRVIHSKAA